MNNPYDTGVAIDPEWPVRENVSIYHRWSLKTDPKSHQTNEEYLAKSKMCQRLLRAKRLDPDYRPRKGEITIKFWRALESDRTGISSTAIAMRLKRGKYPDLKIRRVNKRVVYVKI